MNQATTTTLYGDTLFVDGGLRRVGIGAKRFASDGQRFFRVVSVHGDTLAEYSQMAAAVEDACRKVDARYAA